MTGWDDQMYQVDPLVSLQTDTVNCGPFFLAITECMTEDSNMEFEPSDLNEYRLYVAAEYSFDIGVWSL
jgi:hypothetical protein